MLWAAFLRVQVSFPVHVPHHTHYFNVHIKTFVEVEFLHGHRPNMTRRPILDVPGRWEEHFLHFFVIFQHLILGVIISVFIIANAFLFLWHLPVDERALVLLSSTTAVAAVAAELEVYSAMVLFVIWVVCWMECQVMGCHRTYTIRARVNLAQLNLKIPNIQI